LPRAGDRIRTDDNNVGNVVLYQLSYTRAPFERVGEENPPKTATRLYPEL
jgi:hypothetical protein